MTKKKKPVVEPASPLPEDGQSNEPIDTQMEVVPAPGTDSKVLTKAGFPIVGLGASAGGLAAIEAFFAAMPQDTESAMAFVLVQHLAPDHKSILIDLVKRYTPMRVLNVEDGMEVQPNCVYIIPPNSDMALLDGKLHLMEPSAPHGLRLPIDFFFSSMAIDQHARAICIVLSGTGTDGTMGLKVVKGEGGMVMAQEPETAAFDGMPRSAIATGLVDYVLPPDKMPEQLIVYVQHAFGRRLPPKKISTQKDYDILNKVFILIRSQTGHDFAQYKPSTIQRHIDRRMALAQIDRLEDYVRYLQESPPEIDALFHELLIGVTNFFRDPQAFESLREHVLQSLFDKPRGGNVRIWVPGCSTGEEAYSLAIMIREYLDERKQSKRVQVFATDIDAKAIEKARAGVYPASIAAEVSPERLARFFYHDPDGDSYRISKSIRDLVIFAKQDVLKDPPFSRIDLISCRNLLIYLGAQAQEKILSIFHYALNQDGYLLLGHSETIGSLMAFYASVDKKWKIYQRRGEGIERPAVAQYTLPMPADGAGRDRQASSRLKSPHMAGARNLAEQALLEAYVPASVLCNTELDVLYIHGHTGKYLEPASGEASLNLLKMTREGLRLALAATVRKALTQQTLVRYDRVQVKSNGDTWLVNIIVQPVKKPESAESLLLVIFEELTPGILPAAQEADIPISDQEQRLVTLENELKTKEEYLQATIEELETTNEELQSSNEELQSSNEELQSTNEELETSQEELQSVNEELITVNTELQKKIEELSQTNNDMNNLLASTNIATLFVDHQLHIQRFTPATTRIINLIPTDIGRPVSDIVSRLMVYDDLVRDTQTVLDTLIPKDVEVQTLEGQWYQMRIQPYRTLENVIEGAVLTFVEVTEMKHTRQALRKSEECIRVALKHTPIMVAMTDRDLRYVWVYDPHPDSDPTSFMGKRDDEIAQNDGTHKLMVLKEQVMKTGVGTRLEIVFPLPGGALTYDIIAEPLRDEGGRIIGVTTAAKDITTSKQAGETPPETG